MARSRIQLLLLALCSCAPDLRSEFPFDGELPAGSYVSHEDQADGTTLTRVDASQKQSWVYLDLDARAQLSASEAIVSPVWDLAFQRFKIISNGGVSGPAGVEVAVLEGVDFAALSQAPASGYRQDAPDSADDADQDLDSPFLRSGGWYFYDLLKHRLIARNVTYVVHAPSGAYWKLQLIDYYDQHGSAAQLSFRWGPVQAP